MRLKYIGILLLLCMALPVAAQKKGAKGGKATKVVKPVAPAETSGQKLFKSMLPATAKVMFIDSVVVSKADFLSRVPLNKESGSLTTRKGKVGHGRVPLTQYQNDFGDRRIYAEGDTTATHLLAQTLVGKQWSAPHPLVGLDGNEYPRACFPFLASDGVTLFFAAQGPHSVGGYDIFMTTYDNDDAQWYEPQNYGLPFNSTANEYLMAIDDYDTLGWLVTDRNQPADSVCIYTFEPTSIRKDFQADDIDDVHLKRYAHIHAIKDTWKFGKRKAALDRLAAMIARGKATSTKKVQFAINDLMVITSPSQLKHAESRSLYAQLQELETLMANTQTTLDNNRKKYAQQPSARQQLRAQIIKLEQQLEQQQADSRALAKRIRKLEN